MVRGILQFTPSIAFRYVLHRCESRDIRCRESLWILNGRRTAARERTGTGAAAACRSVRVPWRGSRRGFFSLSGRGAPGGRWAARRAGTEGGSRPRPLPPRVVDGFSGRSAGAGLDNDPSAGSPTETLLRLLLPLNDKVQWTSRDVAGSGPPTSPRSEHFTGPFNR